jgi:hypothetical protein
MANLTQSKAGPIEELLARDVRLQNHQAGGHGILPWPSGSCG